MRLGPVDEGWRGRDLGADERAAVDQRRRRRAAGHGHRAAPSRASSSATHRWPTRSLRQRLAQAYIEDRLVTMTNQRAADRRRAGQPAGPEASITKLFFSEHTQRLQNLARRPRGSGRAGVARRRSVVAEHRVVVPARAVEDDRRRNVGGAAQHPRRACARLAEGTRGRPLGAVVGGSAFVSAEPADPTSLADIAVRRARRDPSTPFVLTLDERGPHDGATRSPTATCSTGRSRSTRALADAGVAPGDRVGCYLPNSPSWVVASLAVWFSGGAVAAAGTLLPPVEAAGAVRAGRREDGRDDDGRAGARPATSPCVRIDDDGSLVDATDPVAHAWDDADLRACPTPTISPSRSSRRARPGGRRASRTRTATSSRPRAAWPRATRATATTGPTPRPAHLAPGVLFNPFGHMAGYSRLAFRMWIGRPTRDRAEVHGRRRRARCSRGSTWTRCSSRRR